MKYQIFSTYTRRGQTQFCSSNFSIKGHFFLSPKICRLCRLLSKFVRKCEVVGNGCGEHRSLNQILKNQQLTSCHGNQIELLWFTELPHFSISEMFQFCLGKWTEAMVWQRLFWTSQSLMAPSFKSGWCTSNSLCDWEKPCCCWNGSGEHFLLLF